MEFIELFNGRDLDGWHSVDDSKDARWRVDNGIMHIVPDTCSIYSEVTFGDALIHVEFMCPKTEGMRPNGTPHRGNSGVYIHGCYEIQIIDSYGQTEVTYQSCGGLYDTVHAPLENASLPRGVWQSYDIIFRAPRFDGDNNVVENARVTVLLNGIVVQNNVEIGGCTPGGMFKEVRADGPLMLQAHSDPVCFRSVKIAKL